MTSSILKLENINQNESVMSSDWVEILRQWLLAKNSCSRKNARYCTRLLKLTFLWPKKWSVVIKEVLWSVLFTEDCSGLRNAHCNMCVWSHQEPVLLSMWLLYDQWYGGGGGWWVWGHQGSLHCISGTGGFLDCWCETRLKIYFSWLHSACFDK